MATVYSDPVVVGNNKVRIKCDYSGISATLSVEFCRNSSGWMDTWGDTDATLTFNGRTASAAYYYSGYVDTTTWITLATVSGYTVPAAGGTLNWTFTDHPPQAVLGCSGTITIPSQATKPSGVSIPSWAFEYSSKGKIALNATVSVADWGTGSSSANEIGLAVNTTETFSYVTETVGTAESVDFYATGYGLDFKTSFAANTRYKMQARAKNTAGSTLSTTLTIYSIANTPSNVTVSSVGVDTATVQWSTGSDGGATEITYLLSLDNGETWIEAGKKAAGSLSATLTKKLGGLRQNTQYECLLKASNVGGETPAVSFSITTLFECAFYVSAPAVPSINVTSANNMEFSDESKIIALSEDGDIYVASYIKFVSTYSWNIRKNGTSYAQGSSADDLRNTYGINIINTSMTGSLNFSVSKKGGLVTREMQKMYVGVRQTDMSLVTTKVKKLYARGTDGLTKLVFAGELYSLAFNTEQISMNSGVSNKIDLNDYLVKDPVCAPTNFTWALTGTPAAQWQFPGDGTIWTEYPYPEPDYPVYATVTDSISGLSATVSVRGNWVP